MKVRKDKLPLSSGMGNLYCVICEEAEEMLKVYVFDTEEEMEECYANLTNTTESS